jgi:hypothetical protein
MRVRVCLASGPTRSSGGLVRYCADQLNGPLKISMLGQGGKPCGRANSSIKHWHSPAFRNERCLIDRRHLSWPFGVHNLDGPVAGLVGIEGGVVSGVINLESSGVEAPDWRPRHDKHYHEA